MDPRVPAVMNKIVGQIGLSSFGKAAGLGEGDLGKATSLGEGNL